ncbi:3-oxoacyl-[acyl-carrier-protein] reductase [soil metagenome]
MSRHPVFRDDALTGRVVFVTGGSRGIGAEIARNVAAAGAHVAVGFHSNAAAADGVVAELSATGSRVIAVRGDVAVEADVTRMVEEVLAEFGHIDGLVNNAGIFPETPFLEITPEEWERVMAVDVNGAYLCTRAVLPSMLERGSGSIVMISSRLGQIGFAGVVHYATAKAGLLAMAKSLAREFGPRGIRVNTVAPGVTLTEMAEDVTTGEVGQKRLAELPAGRFALASEVADSVTFLLSDAATLFHGQTLCPNGGGYMP